MTEQRIFTTGAYCIKIHHPTWEESPPEYVQRRREYARVAFLEKIEPFICDGREYYLKMKFTTELEEGEYANGEPVANPDPFSITEYLHGSVYLLNPEQAEVGEIVMMRPSTTGNMVIYANQSRFQAKGNKGNLWVRVA